MSNQIEVIQLLLERGANRKAQAHSRRTPQQIAEMYGHLEAARLVETWQAPKASPPPSPPPVHARPSSAPLAELAKPTAVTAKPESGLPALARFVPKPPRTPAAPARVYENLTSL